MSSPSAEFYLKKHHLSSYVEDAVTLLLEKKEEDPKFKPYDILAEYFESVKKGTHICFREYNFVSMTPHNRASFIKCFWNAYSEVAVQVGAMKVLEYLSLIRLLCFNFPSDIILRVGRVIFSFDVTDNKTKFPDFLYTFQTVFYYEKFLLNCEHICMEIANGQTPVDALNSKEMVVALPSADQIAPEPPSLGYSVHSKVSVVYNETEVQVDRQLFVKAVKGICRKYEKEPWDACLSVDVLLEVIEEMKTVTFYNFVLALSRSESVNQEIGILPDRTVLMETSSENVCKSTES